MIEFELARSEYFDKLVNENGGIPYQWIQKRTSNYFARLKAQYRAQIRKERESSFQAYLSSFEKK